MTLPLSPHNIGHNAQPFEAGKTYRTRDGREAELGTVSPLQLTGMLRAPWEGRVIGSPWSWYPDGNWLSGEPSGCDLIEECEATL